MFVVVAAFKTKTEKLPERKPTLDNEGGHGHYPPEQTEAKLFGSQAILSGPLALRPCIATGLPLSEITTWNFEV
jgi:hypothetical protein